MDFNKFASMASSALSDDKKEGAPAAAQPSDQKWAEVGALAKKTAEEFQKDRAEGKGPDYQEIGQVAQKAFSAYQSEGGDKADLTKIGKSIAGGVMGGKVEEPPAPAPAPAEAPAEAPAPEAKPEGEDAPAPAPAPAAAPEAAPPAEDEKKEVLPEGADDVAKQAAQKFGVSEDQASSIMSAGLKAFGSR